MEAIKIEVNGNIARVTERPDKITSGTVGLPVEFTFDSQWESLRKIAVFQAGDIQKDMVVVDGATVVPIENMETPNVRLHIGVYGVNEDGSIAIPTIWANAGQIYSGAVPDGDLGSDIGTAKEQYAAAVLAAEKAESSADRAEKAATDAEEFANRASNAEEAAVRAENAEVSAQASAARAEESADRAEQIVSNCKPKDLIVEVTLDTVVNDRTKTGYADVTANEIYEHAANGGTVVLYVGYDRYEHKVRNSGSERAFFERHEATAEGIKTSRVIISNGDMATQTSGMIDLSADAVTYTPQDLTKEQKTQARANIGANTMEDTVEKFCPPFAASGYTVSCEPVEGYPLEVVSQIEPAQSGSGDPLPNNIRPIIGHSEVKLNQGGKNLLAYPYVDTTKTVDGMTFTDNGDGSITLNGTSTSPYLSYTLHLATFADALKDGVTYRLSTGTDDTNIAIVCYYKNESGASVWASNDMTWKKEYTLLQVYLQVTEVATYTNMVLYPQIEIGTTATAYEPYKGETFTMDLGQEVYGGSLNWNTGVLTIDWVYEELDGVEKKFYKRSPYMGTDNYLFAAEHYPSQRVSQGNMLCSHLLNRCDIDAGLTYISGSNIVCNINGFTTLDEANAWLVAQKQNGTPFQLCYELQEPITIQLTPQEITALSGTNILSSNTGITEVTGRANPVAIINNLENRLAAIEKAVVNNA